MYPPLSFLSSINIEHLKYSMCRFICKAECLWYNKPMKTQQTQTTKDPVLRALQAASDPIRLNILTCLMLDEEKHITSESYNIVKSTLSHHIKLLKEAHLIQEIKLGKTKKYVLNHTYIKQELPGLLELIHHRALQQPR